MVLIGRLTKDAVVSQLKDERKVLNFTLVVNDQYKPKGSDKWESIATYFTCAYWINPKVAERLKKGNLVEVAGRVYATAYTDMQGDAKASLHFHVDAIKVHQQMKASTNGNTQVNLAKTEHATEDLPF